MVPLPGFIRDLTVPPNIDPLPKLALKPDFQSTVWEPSAERSVDVGWFDVDQNQHVNNVSYVEWLLEAIDTETLQTRELAEIDLVYRSESHWNDTLRVLSGVETSETFLHRIEHNESGKDTLLARSKWRHSRSVN